MAPSLLRFRTRISARFRLVLGALAVGVLILCAVALQGLSDLRGANSGLRVAVEETSIDGRTRADLLAFTSALQLFMVSEDAAFRGNLRETLDGLAVDIEVKLAEMRRRYERRPVDRALTLRQERPFRTLLGAWRSEVGAQAGPETRQAAKRRLDGVRQISLSMERAADELARRDVMLSRAAERAADAGYRRTRRLVMATLLGLVGIGVGVAVWLVHSVVPRTRRYSEFAVQVAGGQLATRVAVEGSDELSDLGHTLNSMVAEREREHEYAETQSELSVALQVAADETEAHGVLKLHVERWVPDSTVTVLNRNNSGDRLEAKTAVADGSPLADGLDVAGPRDCLAVRFARPHSAGGDGRQPLLGCKICGGIPGTSTCNPLLVGGEVIGSVLVNTPGDLDREADARLKDSVVQAAPVLGNLRNLAIAELRAATDSLTGLPNNRAVRDTTRQMVAKASRSLQPLAVALLDLDHFKQINDTFGHGRGDEVLAAVGAILSETVRESDFVGRMGGEEFLMLLPDTNVEGARVICEKVRAAICHLDVLGVDRDVTASVGLAVIPDHGGDGDELIRAADRALYTAKENGRNALVVASPSDALRQHQRAAAEA